MNELFQLFEEMIAFEAQLEQSDGSQPFYPDKERAREIFNNYLERRFNQIQPKLEDPAEWSKNLTMCA